MILTGVEVGRYVTRAVITNKTAGYFIYTGYFPQAVAYSPNGKYLALCTPIASPIDANSHALKGSVIDLHDPETGRKLKSVYSGDTRFDSISFSKDNNLLYAYSSSKKVAELYDLRTGESRPVFRDFGSLASLLNISNNSVVSVYKTGISILKLAPLSGAHIAFPKKIEALDGSAVGLNFSEDNRFVSWVVYSQDNSKKILRVADMKEGKVCDLQSENGSGVPYEEVFRYPIVASQDGKSVYLTGNVVKSASLNDFSRGIIEVNMESGEIKNAQHQYSGIGVSHIKGGTVFVKNALGETALLAQWERPVDTLLSVPNAIATSPDKRWCLTYERYGLKRVPMKTDYSDSK